jgi:CRISPR-associated protein Cas1
LENSTLCLEIDRALKARFPLHHLSSVVLFGDIMITPAAVCALAEARIALVYLDRNGRFRARMEGPVNGNVLLRSAQHQLRTDAVFPVQLAQNLLAGKIQNSRYVLMRGARESKSETEAIALRELAQKLDRILKKLPGAPDMDTLRGYEGDAAKQYFSAINYLIVQDQRVHFSFQGRNRRPPLDAVNALFSFLYSMLMNDCHTALEATGLDPQVGFLHTIRPGRAALALDLMEEFRPLLADRLALTLINRKQLTAKDFQFLPGGAVQLSDNARRTVIQTYQERKKETLQHPLLQEPITIGLLPFLQARLLARVLRKDTDQYLPYLAR